MNDVLDRFEHPTPLSAHYLTDVAGDFSNWPLSSGVARRCVRRTRQAGSIVDGGWEVSVVAEKVEQVAEGYRALMSDCSGI